MKNTNQNPAIVGNIVFGETGVSIIRPYMTSDAVTTAVMENNPNSNEDVEKALVCALQFVKARLAHCQAELEANLSKAYAVSEYAVYWKGGHFTLPTFQLMEQLLERNPKSWDDLSVPELQQVVRALYHQRQAKTETWWSSEICHLAFNIATEFLICKA
jgi:hypothetical protein